MRHLGAESLEPSAQKAKNTPSLCSQLRIYAETATESISSMVPPKSCEARKILKQLTEQSDSRFPASPLIARIHLGLGETEQGMEWLRKGVEERSYWMTMLNGDPVYDGIRSDPRFRDLLKRIGFQSVRPTGRARSRGA